MVRNCYITKGTQVLFRIVPLSKVGDIPAMRFAANKPRDAAQIP